VKARKHTSLSGGWSPSGASWLGSLVLAACAVSGVIPRGVHAEEAPEQGVIAFKLSGYTESQSSIGSPTGSSSDDDGTSIRNARRTAAGGVTRSGASGGGGGSVSLGGEKRISVLTPSVYALVPLDRHWAIEGSLTVDDVSGASPSYYSDLSGASHMEDRRTAADLKLTRYFERQSVALGLSRSKEDDYASQALSLEGRWASDDQNTTWNAGVGLTRDTVNPYNQIVHNASKRVDEWQMGVTQAVSSRDLVQLGYTWSRARGYLNDPYKTQDSRPDHRNAHIVQLRWNHWLGGSALKAGYRYYQDSYQVRAHTLDVAWVMPLSSSTTLTPSVRYYTQSAAAFYADPSADATLYPGPEGSPRNFSADQRLSAFGALTLGGKVSWQFAPSGRPTPSWSCTVKTRGGVCWALARPAWSR